MTGWTSFAIRWLLDQEKVRLCIEAKEGQPLDEKGNNNHAMNTGGDALHFQQPQAAEIDCWEKSETVTPDLLYTGNISILTPASNNQNWMMWWSVILPHCTLLAPSI